MKRVYKIENLDCAHCAAKLERIVLSTKGVISANVAFMTSRLTLEANDEEFEEVLQRVKKAVNKQNPDWIITR